MSDATVTLISLQPGQPGEGLDYCPSKPLPYPIFVGDDDRCENVPGKDPAGVRYPLAREVAGSGRRMLPKLVGFQKGAAPNPESMLSVDRWRLDPETAVGMYPVFCEPAGFDAGMFNLNVPITSVSL